MKFLPNTPREVLEDYWSQWRDDILKFAADSQVSWLLEDYPYSFADQRARNYSTTGLPGGTIFTEDDNVMLTESGNTITKG
jgi:hypothetical protein